MQFGVEVGGKASRRAMETEQPKFKQPRMVEIVCPQCHKTNTLVVEFEDFVAFQIRGKYAQEAFPYLSAGERELLISGVCDPCFQKLFPPEDE